MNKNTLPNVLLIILDSVRAQNTSLHGHTRDTTPFMADFAKQKIVFNQARSPSVASLPSHISIFTGFHTEEHEFGNHDHRDYRLAQGTTIWEELKENYNYSTGIFSTNPYLTSLPVGIKSKFDMVASSELPYFDALDPRRYYDSDNGANIGKWIFDSMCSGKPIRSIINGISVWFNSGNRQNMLPSRFQPTELPEIFLNWIDELNGESWASCINLMDAHTPYTPSPQFDRWSKESDWTFQEKIDHFRWQFTGREYDLDNLQNLERLYDGAILEADNKIKRIVHGLEDRDILKQSLVVITSDHGEGFGEKSNIRPNQHSIGHTVGIHESQLHVPLVVHLPDHVKTCNSEINELASLTKFPSVVKSTINREESPEKGFISDNGAIATQPAIGKEDRDLAESYGTEIDGVTGRMRAAYQKESDKIYKYVSWKDIFAKIDIEENTTMQCGKNDIVDIIEDSFSSIIPRGIKIKQSVNIDEAAEDRLSDLGYI